MPIVCVAVFGLSACGQTARTHGLESASKPAVMGRAPGRATRRAAAGDDTLPAGVVARAGRHAISGGTLDHWLEVLAITQYQQQPTRPVPRGVVPRPPGYRDCIAYSAENAKTAHTRPAPDTAQLKRPCELRREALLRQALETLIVHYWVQEEAAKAGIALTVQEVRREVRGQFPTKTALRRFLAFTGLHLSDVRLLFEDALLPAKWQSATLPAYARLRRSKRPETIQMSGEIDTEVAALRRAMSERWTPRTHCRKGYVVTGCSEHRG